jgi:hypothetical protein
MPHDTPVDDSGHVPTPVTGGGAGKGAPDGVSNAPGKTSGGGESAGGAYPNDAAKGQEGGFMGHGGQSNEAYSGPGDEDDRRAGGDNAVSDD